jgi:hypothetical protein
VTWAARGARLRKYGVDRIHRAAEKRRTVGSCVSRKEQQALIHVWTSGLFVLRPHSSTVHPYVTKATL